MNNNCRAIFLLSVFVSCTLLHLASEGASLCLAQEPQNFINLYGAQMTANTWDDFFSREEVREQDSYLLTLALGRRLGRYKDLASFEVEGQLVKHFRAQDHLEINALATARWEEFFWDRFLDTSLAFGLGPSYATEKPKIEVKNHGNSSRLLVYWMLEMAFALPDQPNLELLARIHHRSSAYGYVSATGGSNALAVGLRYRF